MEELYEGAFRICVPFEEIYTSVFVFCNPYGCFIVDGGANAFDAERYILPVLQREGMVPQLIVRSHSHGDHSGGVERIARQFPASKIALIDDNFPNNGKYLRLYDGDMLLKRFQVLNLTGHTDDGLALYDTQTKTLFSFDCLQFQGVGKYGVSFTDDRAYLQSVARVKGMEIQQIIASHDFFPYGYRAYSKGEAEKFLNVCVQYLQRERK